MANGTTNGKIYGVKGKAVTVRFFGWADTNQMPIRRVKVDWTDGTSIVTNGKYKNHKPYCSESDKPSRFCVKGNGLKKGLGDGLKEINITCRTNADCTGLLGTAFSCPPEKVCDGSISGAADFTSCASNTECVEKTLGACVPNPKLEWVFGNMNTMKTPACEENTFNFVHGYSYSQNCGFAKGADKDLKSAVYPKNLLVNDDTRAHFGLPASFKDGDAFCVWKPRVQLLDNWGWCNGVTSASATDATAKGWHNDESGDVGATNVNRCESNAQGFIKDINATPFDGYIVVKN